ncbi:MAG: tetratricopeptide repeat protein [Campylobacterales bacterium]|nr:tetratricopeptide repeat protein [Campylobacterales bacterium]
MRYIVTIVFIFISLFGVENLQNTQDLNATKSSCAIELKKGLEAHSKNDLDVAVKCLEPLAQNGEPTAQLTMGIMCFWGGSCVPKNIDEALKWYTLSANQGNASAQYKLGELYYHGTEIKQNLSEAVRWYVASANQGNAVSQSRLGHIYTFGEGIPVDYKEAMRWYTLAIKSGNKKAKCDIFEPILASNDTKEIKQRAKTLLTKAYNETHERQCKRIYDRYKLQDF